MVRMLENQFDPDYVSPPGETLLEAIETLGMTQAELAQRTGRPRKTINEIIKGRASITPETAIQLERALGVPSSFWNNRQRRYDEFQARHEEQRRLEEQVEWVRQFPYGAMVKFGWIEGASSDIDKLQLLLGFFGVASPEVWEKRWESVEVDFRKSTAFDVDKYALASWLRRGELGAREVDCLSYDKNRFLGLLGEVRALTIEPPEVFQPRMVQLCASCGVAVVFVPELPKTRVSAATRWLSKDKALIQLSLRYKSDDHLWFSFFHEVGHIVLHPKRVMFLEYQDKGGAQEDEADRFSTEILIPRKALKRLIETERITLALIQNFAADQGIAPGIVVGQLQKKDYLDYSIGNKLKRWFKWAF